jgi:sugar transferase (PEP-CTERM/EpsH1 system associated)
MITGGSATEGLFDSPQLARQVKDWQRSIRFDAALVFCSSMVQYIDPKMDGQIPWFVDLVDVDSEKWFDYQRQAQGIKRCLFGLEGCRLQKLERTLQRRCRAITLTSESEVDLYRRTCPNANVIAVGNGVDLEYYHPCHDVFDKPLPFQIVFVGALDYRANVQSLQWFCDQCWPLIQQNLPQARLVLVGRNPVQAIKKLTSDPTVQLVGEVPDIRPYVWQSSIAIAPLQIARGIQNKVLEAMAMQIPVIASPQAIEGIRCCVGTDLLRAKTPRDWATSVVELLSDPEKQESLAQSGRRFVERQHSWEKQLDPLWRLLHTQLDDSAERESGFISMSSGHSREPVVLRSR